MQLCVFNTGAMHALLPSLGHLLHRSEAGGLGSKRASASSGSMLQPPDRVGLVDSGWTWALHSDDSGQVHVLLP